MTPVDGPGEHEPPRARLVNVFAYRRLPLSRVEDDGVSLAQNPDLAEAGSRPSAEERFDECRICL